MTPRLLIRLPDVDRAAACDVARLVAAWAAARPHLTATVRASTEPTTYAQVEVDGITPDDLLPLAAIVEPFAWPAKPLAQLITDPDPLTA